MSNVGFVVTWGGNEKGQLGHHAMMKKRHNIMNNDDNQYNDEKESSHRPPSMFALPSVKVRESSEGGERQQVQRAASVSCGNEYTAVLTTRMSVYFAGISEITGISTTKLSSSPLPHPTNTIPVLEGLPILSVSAGECHCVVVTIHGTAYAWGRNTDGECGRPYPTLLMGHPIPIRVPKTERRIKNKQHYTNNHNEFDEQYEPFLNWSKFWDEEKGSDNLIEREKMDETIMMANQNNDDTISLASDVSIAHAACGKNHTVLVTKNGDLLVCGRFYNVKHDDINISTSSLSSSCITSAQRVTHPNVLSSNMEEMKLGGKGTRFTMAEAGDGNTLLLDDVGDIYQIMGHCCDNNDDAKHNTERKGKNNSLEPKLILKGKNVQTIAAGGKECIAITAPPSKVDDVGSASLQRLFSITNNHTNNENSKNLINTSLAANFEGLLELLAVGANDKEDDNGDNAHNDNRSRESIVQELANRTEETLKYPAVVNSLFMNPAELYKMSQKLISVMMFKKKVEGEYVLTLGNDTRSSIAKAVYDGISMGLDRLRTHDARLRYPESVRCLLLYIHFFEWMDMTDNNDNDCEGTDNSYNTDSTSVISTSSLFTFDPKGECIQSLCETILSLPFEGYNALLSWAIGGYNIKNNNNSKKKLFVQMLIRPLLKQLNSALKVTIDDDDVEHWSSSRKAVPVIVAVLSWLYNASIGQDNNYYSDSNDNVLAEPHDFYCTGLSELSLELLYHDLSEYKKRKGMKPNHSTFFLTANPFLFHPEKKRELLSIENEVEMYRIGSKNASYDPETQQLSFDPYFKLEIDRDNMFEQTLECIREVKSPKDLRKKLMVVFRGEEGIDAGGVSMEFFQLLSEDLFDVNSSLWSKRYGEGVTWFNSDCVWDDKGYELVGLLVGLAFYNGVLLDAHFPQALYRKLLGLSLGLEDMIDEDLKKNLGQLLDYENDDVEDIFCVNFEVTWMNLGQEQTIELKPGGSHIPVSNQNREEYVLLYVKWVLVDSIAHQWDAFQRGIMTIMECSSLTLFRPKELELLLVGTPDLDWSALQVNTEYEGGYDKNSDSVKHFWKYIHTMSRESQIKLMKFVTGCGRAPIGGLGVLPFKIQRSGPDTLQLPTSHTCFNTLILPDYNTFDKLEERLGRAITECEGFGLV